jgi:APA family basic amino acid/polyamine antiporter
VKQPDLARPYRTPFYPFTPLVFLGVTAYMLVHTALSKPWESACGLALPLVGLVLHAVLVKCSRRVAG